MVGCKACYRGHGRCCFERSGVRWIYFLNSLDLVFKVSQVILMTIS